MQNFSWALIDSPIDPFLAIMGRDGLVAYEFDGTKRLASATKRLSRVLGDKVEMVEAPRRGGALAPVRDWTWRYFSGEVDAKPEFDIDLLGTPFQVAVWEALLDIPAGRTQTYGDLALRVGQPVSAARAVGAAVGSNPVPVIVPCHRIIGADGSLTGFGGGLPRKKWLLAHERDHSALGQAAAKQLAMFEG